MTEDDFETMCAHRDREDSIRGYSRSYSGFVVSVGHRPVAPTPTHRSDSPQVCEGFACRYDLVHDHKGRKEMFAKGCFDGSLHGVFMGIDHNMLSKKLGDQDDETLELFDTPVGLAFRLKLSIGDLDLLGGRDQMSTMYQERNVELRQIGNETVRVITSASLFEVSAVFSGAVTKTFAVVRNASSVGSLRDDAVCSFPSAAAFAVLQRALGRLQ
jgi:phage head maturation protease